MMFLVHNGFVLGFVGRFDNVSWRCLSSFEIEPRWNTLSKCFSRFGWSAVDFIFRFNYSIWKRIFTSVNNRSLWNSFSSNFYRQESGQIIWEFNWMTFWFSSDFSIYWRISPFVSRRYRKSHEFQRALAFAHRQNSFKFLRTNFSSIRWSSTEEQWNQFDQSLLLVSGKSILFSLNLKMNVLINAWRNRRRRKSSRVQRTVMVKHVRFSVFARKDKVHFDWGGRCEWNRLSRSAKRCLKNNT